MIPVLILGAVAVSTAAIVRICAVVAGGIADQHTERVEMKQSSDVVQLYANCPNHPVWGDPQFVEGSK